MREGSTKESKKVFAGRRVRIKEQKQVPEEAFQEKRVDPAICSRERKKKLGKITHGGQKVKENKLEYDRGEERLYDFRGGTYMGKISRRQRPKSHQVTRATPRGRKESGPA